MDAQRFLAEFGHIANAPGGVDRMRELVYELAGKGLLVTNGEEIGDTHLDLVADFVMGQAPPAAECNTSGVGVVFVKTGEFGVIYPVVREWTTKPLKLAKQGDILICVVGATIGKLNLAIDCAIGRSVAAIRPHKNLDVKYTYYSLMPFTLRLRRGSRGSAQGVIGKAELSSVRLRVPSLEEQARIVAKVDELMALCDRLEAQQQERRSLQNKLRQSTLQAVAAANRSQELQTAWTRLADNFGQLFDAREDVDELRGVIFGLCLRGVLLPETSLEIDALSDEKSPLPSGWQWKTLGDMTEYITSGSRGWKGYMTVAGDAFIRSQDIKQDALVFENPAFVTLPEKTEGQRTLVHQGDLLLTITGGNVGKCAIVPALNFRAYVSQHVALIRLVDPEMTEFVHFWMINANGGRGFLSRFIYGDKPGLNLAQVASIPIPVPPIFDMQRILQSLRQYQLLFSQFSRQIKDERKLAEMLSASSVAAITGIATEPKEEVSVKAPHTEIVAPLRLGILPAVGDASPLATLLARHKGSMNAGDLFQRYGGEVDAFYAQLKLEISRGWIEEPPSQPDAEGFASVRVKEQA